MYIHSQLGPLFLGYGRRRGEEPLDDSEYTPDYFGIQCPPYEDPPPPYTPPKPAPGEAPPPYEAIDGNNDDNGNSESERSPHRNVNIGNRGSTQNGPNCCGEIRDVVMNSNMFENAPGSSVTEQSRTSSRSGNRFSAINSNSDRNSCSMNERSSGIRQNGDVNNRVNNQCVNNIGGGLERVQMDGLQQSGSAMNRAAVHFRNNSCAHPCITMGIQNRNRNYRNRLSDITLNNSSSPVRSADNRNSLGNEHTRALSLELHNAIHNLQNRGLHSIGNRNNAGTPGDASSSTTDIGESTTSAESLTSSPESPNYETDNAVSANGNTSNNSNNGVGGNEADTTVKRFLDRHFGGSSANSRRYPTTMSQSWTSPQNSTPFQNFKQSVSMVAFPACGENVGHPVIQSSTGILANLPRSKSEHLKTNGSLINQPFNSVVVPGKPQLPHVGRAVRVAYKDAEELNLNERVAKNHRQTNNDLRNSEQRNCDQNSNSYLERSFDSDVFDSASNVSSLTAAILDPGEIIVTKRQDELRNLRLSHLLSQPYMDHDHGNQSCGNSPRFLHRSLSENSLEASSLSFSPVSGDRTLAVLGSDAKYPTNCLQAPPVPRNKVLTESKHRNREHENFGKSQVSRSSSTVTATGCSDVSSKETGSRDSRTSNNQSTPRKETVNCDKLGRATNSAMVHSWHAGVSDDTSAAKLETTKMNTLGRNVNKNFEKKSLGDKDVINSLFPHFKPSNVENDTAEDTRFVPNSEMRACASQLYNYETEDNPSNRNRRKSLFKRHSTGCFPTKHEHANHNRANPQRLKSSQERQQSHRSSDATNDNRRSSSRDRKAQRRVMSYERDNSLIMHENSKTQSDQSHPYLMHSAIPKDFNLLDRGLLNSKSDQGQQKSDKRSRSLGRNSATNKKPGPESNSSSSGRKKKAYSSQFNPFYAELEHVLEGKQSVKNSPSKSCRPLYNNGDKGTSAITQV